MNRLKIRPMNMLVARYPDGDWSFALWENEGVTPEHVEARRREAEARGCVLVREPRDDDSPPFYEHRVPPTDDGGPDRIVRPLAPHLPAAPPPDPGLTYRHIRPERIAIGRVECVIRGRLKSRQDGAPPPGPVEAPTPNGA